MNALFAYVALASATAATFFFSFHPFDSTQKTNKRYGNSPHAFTDS